MSSPRSRRCTWSRPQSRAFGSISRLATSIKRASPGAEQHIKFLQGLLRDFIMPNEDPNSKKIQMATMMVEKMIREGIRREFSGNSTLVKNEMDMLHNRRVMAIDIFKRYLLGEVQREKRESMVIVWRLFKHILSAIYLEFNQSTDPLTFDYITSATYFASAELLTRENKKIMTEIQYLKDLHNVEVLTHRNQDELTEKILVTWKLEKTMYHFLFWKQVGIVRRRRIKQVIKYFRAFRVNIKRAFFAWVIWSQKRKYMQLQDDFFFTRNRANKAFALTDQSKSTLTNIIGEFKTENAEIEDAIIDEKERLEMDYDNEKAKEKERTDAAARIWTKYFSAVCIDRVKKSRVTIDEMLESGRYMGTNEIVAFFKKNTRRNAWKFKTPTKENITTLSHENFVLSWANFIIGDTKTVINNFAADLKDGVAYGRLLYRLDPVGAEDLISKKKTLRFDAIVGSLTRLGVNEGPLVTTHIPRSSTMNFILMSRLLVNFPSLTIDHTVFTRENKKLEEVQIRCHKLRRSRKTREPNRLVQFIWEIRQTERIVNMRCRRVREESKAVNKMLRNIAQSAQDCIIARMRKLSKYTHDGETQNILDCMAENPALKKQKDFTNTHTIHYWIENNLGDVMSTFFSNVPLSTASHPFGDLDDDDEPDPRPMKEQHFLKMLRSHELIGDKATAGPLTEDEAKQIFKDVLEDESYDGINIPEFLAALILMGNQGFKNVSKLSSGRMKYMYNRHFKCTSPADLISTPNIVKVLNQKEKDLLKIYHFYAKITMKRLNSMGFLHCREFISMIKDCKMVHNLLSLSVLRKHVGHEDSNTFLNFADFLKCLGVISCYANPNPYIPFRAKYCHFLAFDIIAPLIEERKMYFKRIVR